MRIPLLVVVAAVMLLCVAGCSHTRMSAIVSVRGGVHQVVTRNRYKLVVGRSESGVQPSMPLQLLQYFNENLKKFQPNVFSDDGMPFMITGNVFLDTQNTSSGNALLVLMTLGVFPSWYETIHGERTTFDVVRNPDARATFDIYKRHDAAFSVFSPLAFACYNGEPEFPKGCENGSVVTLHSSGRDGMNFNDAYESAKAYAIAALLKMMEDDGRIDVASGTNAGMPAPQISQEADKFEIVDFKRDAGSEHSYSFTIKHSDGEGFTMRDTRDLKKSVRAMVRADYMGSFPYVDSRSLVVDFPEFALRDGVIVGKSAVLLLSVESLKYDANTRVGTMRIRIGEKQFEDARRYARKNIESLVRDKNVALDAKGIPDSATFYLRDETLKGDVLEITFKTE